MNAHETIEILDKEDRNLTPDFIREVSFYGKSRDGVYTYKDYLYDSEIRRDGKLVAIIHSGIDQEHDYIDEKED